MSDPADPPAGFEDPDDGEGFGAGGSEGFEEGADDLGRDERGGAAEVGDDGAAEPDGAVVVDGVVVGGRVVDGGVGRVVVVGGADVGVVVVGRVVVEPPGAAPPGAAPPGAAPPGAEPPGAAPTGPAPAGAPAAGAPDPPAGPAATGATAAGTPIPAASSPGPGSGPRCACRSTCVAVVGATTTGTGPRSVIAGAARPVGRTARAWDVGPWGAGVEEPANSAPSPGVIASEVEVPATVWNTAVLSAAAPISDTPATATRRRRAPGPSSTAVSPTHGDPAGATPPNSTPSTPAPDVLAPTHSSCRADPAPDSHLGDR